MILGIMQPYLFPYIGYYQLINVVDKYVIYDDVNFIKQGWINKNRILSGGKELVFTVPLKNQSSFVTINKTEINLDLFVGWKNKFLKTVTHSYSRAPFFQETFALLEDIFGADHKTISALATDSIITVSNYLDIKTDFVRSSEIYGNADLHATDRILDICRREGASHYLNAIGGRELYDFEVFAKHGVCLNFMKAKPLAYQQFKNEFVPWLYIIDVLMFNGKEVVKAYLNNYEIITNEV